MSDEYQFRLPARLDGYLATLNRLYEQAGEQLLREIVVNGVVSVHEGWDCDNWNGGTYGHAITLTVPEELYVLAMSRKDALQNRIKTDINDLDNTRDEYVSQVFLEMQPPESDRWRDNTGLYRPRSAASFIPPKALQRIWGPGHVRVFLSHKSTIKVEASNLKRSLNCCGLAAFVAHHDIEADEKWQDEIERALLSMDALVALLSPDFHDSDWTDQEVGVAIGRGVPAIAVRLGRDPYGLMGRRQGLGGCRLSDTNDMAVKLFRLLHKRLPDKSRLFECALSAYAASRSFADSASTVEHLLSVFEDLRPEQLTGLLDAHQRNGQNMHSFKGG